LFFYFNFISIIDLVIVSLFSTPVRLYLVFRVHFVAYCF